jgi:hypothetical protein
MEMLNAYIAKKHYFELRSKAQRYCYSKSKSIAVTMQTDNTLIDIEEEQILDRVTAEQLAKIVEFLLNLED